MASDNWRAHNRIRALREEGIEVPEDLDRHRADFESAVVQNVALFGENHQEVAHAIENLGLALYGLDELDEARAVLERALTMNEMIFGPDHLEVARTLYHLGLVLKALGEQAAARAILMRSRTILRTADESWHPLATRVAAALRKLD
jgi:tetratricopeptide (TPR) repeat protein